MYKHYGKGFEVANELPLFIVVNMLNNAIKKETEQQIYPLWLAHFVISKLTNQEIIPIEKLMGVKINENIKQSSKEEILNKFQKIVDIDKKKRGVSNG